MDNGAIKKFLEGFVSGVAGFAIGIIYEALFSTFALFNPAPVFYLLLGTALFLDILAGIKEVFVGGLSFAVGLLIAGAYLEDYSTILISLVGMFGLLFGIYIKGR